MITKIDQRPFADTEIRDNITLDNCGHRVSAEVFLNKQSSFIKNAAIYKDNRAHYFEFNDPEIDIYEAFKLLKTANI